MRCFKTSFTTSPFFIPNEERAFAALSESRFISAKEQVFTISVSSVQTRAIFYGYNLAHSSTTS
jgi:hypothetical protein